jgi:type I restriction enzyme M protein
MSEDQKKQLEQKLWAIADILRGKISANQFQDYILGFIFYKYLSEKLEKKANEFLKTDGLIFSDIDENTKAGNEILAALKEETVDALPTLSEIEASTLAKETTVDETLKAAKLAAALSA